MTTLTKFLKKKPEPEYRQIVFTTGYTDKNVRHLPILLHNLNAVLVDIRFNAVDSQIQWGKDYLKLLLKDKYRHVPSLGNRAEDDGGGDASRISIQNLNLGIRILTDLKVNLLLMCRCRFEENCHRRLVAEKLREDGFEVGEIDEWE